LLHLIILITVYPVITDSDEEDMDDVTWQPTANPEERMSRKQVKCLYSKKKTDKSNGTVKRLVNCLKMTFA